MISCKYCSKIFDVIIIILIADILSSYIVFTIVAVFAIYLEDSIVSSSEVYSLTLFFLSFLLSFILSFLFAANKLYNSKISLYLIAGLLTLLGIHFIIKLQIDLCCYEEIFIFIEYIQFEVFIFVVCLYFKINSKKNKKVT